MLQQSKGQSLMLYLDDRLPTHPKILKAGALLGKGGASQALHLYLLGISYSRQHLTDGFVSDAFLLSVRGLFASDSIAVALADKRIRLWRKVRGGYQIHDYHHYNPKASEVKEKRERDRQRKAAERHGRNGNLSTMDTLRTRARAVPRTTYHVPRKSTSTDAPRRLAFARETNPATFALACVVMREALAEAEADDIATVGEVFKQLCASRGLAYDGVLVRKAFDAVQVADARRRA
jgi:hypothetical protein